MGDKHSASERDSRMAYSTWLDSYFVEGEGKEFGGFYNMDYEILMDWIERGILTVSPSPQTIAGYLVNYIHTTPVLEKRDITINEHIWYLFEYDCGQNWHANPAKDILIIHSSTSPRTES